MRWDDVALPITGPLLFVVVALALAITVAALRCGLDDEEPPEEGPDKVWEWHRSQGVIRLTAPANLMVRFGVDEWETIEDGSVVHHFDGVWIVNAQPVGSRFVGTLRCTLSARDGPCEDTPTIERVGEEVEQWSERRHRAILVRIVASYEWEPAPINQED